MTTAPRRARRTDANQQAIAAGLAALPGVSVLRLNAECDLLVGHGGRNYLLEVKNPTNRRPSYRNKSPVQASLRANWRGQYSVVESLDEALVIIGAARVFIVPTAPLIRCVHGVAAGLPCELCREFPEEG